MSNEYENKILKSLKIKKNLIFTKQKIENWNKNYGVVSEKLKINNVFEFFILNFQLPHSVLVNPSSNKVSFFRKK